MARRRRWRDDNGAALHGRKVAVGWYLGTTAANSGYGAAGALILILLWIYYSAQIFLFGAEIARAIAGAVPKLPDAS